MTPSDYKQRKMSLSPRLFNLQLVFPANAIRQEKKFKAHRVERKKFKHLFLQKT